MSETPKWTPPIMLITSGPTGSGKSKLPNVVFDLLGIENPAHETILIDDFVEKDATYKKEIYKILSEYKKNENTVEAEFTEENLTDVDLRSKFNDQYWATRLASKKRLTNLTDDHPIRCNYTPGIDTDKIDIKQEKGETCAKLNPTDSNEFEYCSIMHDVQLRQSIGKKNVVYETQGTSFPYWLWDNCFVTEKTPIIIAYSLVKRDELRTRIIRRTLQNINDFFNTYNPDIESQSNAPRLTTYPDITGVSTTEGNDFDGKLYAIAIQIKNLLEQCENNSCTETIFDSDVDLRKKKEQKKLGSTPVEEIIAERNNRKSNVRILIYNNNVKERDKPQLIYDSEGINRDNPVEEVYQEVLKHLGINEEFMNKQASLLPAKTKGGIMNRKVYKTVKQRYSRKKTKSVSTRKTKIKRRNNTKQTKYKKSKKQRV
jgi:hypothetical protein